MAKHWESDFRYPAIQASMAQVEREPQQDALDRAFSFCLPVTALPLPSWITPDKISLLFLILGMGGLAAGAIMAATMDLDDGGIKMWIAASSSLTGMLLLFMPALLHKRMTIWKIGDRVDQLLSRFPRMESVCCELGDSINPTLSIDGDDHVLILFDTSNRRLLIEGLAASYQIRGDDVSLVGPFEFGGALGAEIECKIAGETFFRFGILRTSILNELIRQVPILPDRWIKNHLLDKCIEVFGENSVSHSV